MRKLVLASALMMLAGTAAGFPIDLQVENRVNDLESAANYSLEIKNNFETNKTFKTSVRNVKQSWWFYDNSFKTLEPGETSELFFNVNATPRTVSGRYNFTLMVATNSGESNSTSDYFILEKEKNIFLDDQRIDKNSTHVRATAELTNTNNDIVRELKIKFQGPEQKSVNKNISLRPGQTENISHAIEMPEKTGRYSLLIEAGSESFDLGEFQISQDKNEVTDKKDTVRRESSWDRTFFTSTKSIRLNNPTDVDRVKSVEQSVPVFLDPITSFTPEPDTQRIQGGAKKVKWNVELSPREQKTVEYSTSYKLPLLALALVFVAFIGVKALEKNPRIVKEYSRTDEGLKITLHVENHSSRALKTVEIKDFIPSILEVDEFKTSDPVVARTEHGTRLEWEIDEMHAGESRALIYTVKPDFEVSADIQLPEAKMISESTGLLESEKLEVESLGKTE